MIDTFLKQALIGMGLIMYGMGAVLVAFLYFLSDTFNAKAPPIEVYSLQVCGIITLNYLLFSAILVGGTFFVRWVSKKLNQ